MTRRFGRNVTILGALSCRGLGAAMGVDGATDAAVFRAFVTHVLVPILQPGDIVVMDVRTRSTASAPRSRQAGPACCTCAILARVVTDRAVLVQAQDLSACGKSAHARGGGRGAERGP
jgi:hypothetical protein